MDGPKIVHVLVDELGDSDFGQIPMCFVSNQPHREDIAQRQPNQVGMLADQQLESARELFVCGLCIHKRLSRRLLSRVQL